VSGRGSRLDAAPTLGLRHARCSPAASAAPRRSAAAAWAGCIASTICGSGKTVALKIYTFLAIESSPLATNLSKPYGGASLLLVAAIVGLSMFGFSASRGGELFGRPLLDRSAETRGRQFRTSGSGSPGQQQTDGRFTPRELERSAQAMR
jgi:hypothetical protein